MGLMFMLENKDSRQTVQAARSQMGALKNTNFEGYDARLLT